MNQDQIDGYQMALDDLAVAFGGGFIVGSVIWSKDPAVHAEACARFDTRRQAVVGSHT